MARRILLPFVLACAVLLLTPQSLPRHGGFVALPVRSLQLRNAVPTRGPVLHLKDLKDRVAVAKTRMAGQGEQNEQLVQTDDLWAYLFLIGGAIITILLVVFLYGFKSDG